MDIDLNDKANSTFIITAMIISMMVLARNTYKNMKYGDSRLGIMLIGLSGAGKTQIFNQLMNLSYRETTPSTREEIGNYNTQYGTLLGIIAVPGRPDLRVKFFNQYRKFAKAVAFVVDSVTIAEKLKENADILYRILLDSEVRSRKLPILIVCNKQDMHRAMNHMIIEAMLEKELNAVRASMANVNNSYLGKRNEDFKFSHLDCTVDVVDCSALPYDNCYTYMDAVKAWLNQFDDENFKY